jgi:hypothetical protein
VGLGEARALDVEVAFVRLPLLTGLLPVCCG